MENQDIYKIVVSVVMIHLMLIFVFEGFEFGTNNPEDSIVLGKLSWAMSNSEAVNNQIADAGLCLIGATQTECEARGCVWDQGQCFNAMEKTTGIDFNFFDVLLSVLKLPLYLGKILLFLGSIAFFEIILSFKLMPIMARIHFMAAFLVSISLWVYNITVLYYIWTFISNWRGTDRR